MALSKLETGAMFTLLKLWQGVVIRVVKAPFFKANPKAVSKRLIKAVKRLFFVVNMMNDCFKMHYTSVHLVVSNRHHDKTIEP